MDIEGLTILRRQLADGTWKVSVAVEGGESLAVRMFDDEPDDFDIAEWLLGRLSDTEAEPPRNAEFIIPEGADPVPAAAGEGGGAPDDDDEGPF